MPIKLLNEGRWANEVKCLAFSHDASVFNNIDYNAYVYASLEERKSLLVKNILVYMKLLEKKAKLDYSSFERDMLEFCSQNNITVGISDIE